MTVSKPSPSQLPFNPFIDKKPPSPTGISGKSIDLCKNSNQKNSAAFGKGRL